MSCKNLFQLTSGQIPTTFKELYAGLTPSAKTTVDCIVAIVNTSQSLAHSMPALVLTSATLKVGHMIGEHIGTTTSSKTAQELEKCIEDQVEAQKINVANPTPAQQSALETIIVNCTAKYCPGIKNFSSCIDCIIPIAIPIIQANPKLTPQVESNLVNLIYSGCINSTPSVDLQPESEWSKWGKTIIYILIAVLILALIGTITFQMKKTN